LYININAPWLSWLQRPTVNRKVVSSSLTGADLFAATWAVYASRSHSARRKSERIKGGRQGKNGRGGESLVVWRSTRG
jgi:hypothetical protein